MNSSSAFQRPSAQPFSWAIVGTGIIATQFATDLAHVPEARIGAFVSRRGQLPDALANCAQKARIVRSLDEVLADPTIDAVYLATPNSLHADQAIACCRRGKPVLVEKPIAIDPDQARAIQDAAKASGSFVMEAMWTRFLPAVAEARGLLAAGAIGTVTSFTAELSYHKPEDPENRFFDPALGGGAALDLGVYPLSVALHLLGKPDRIGGRWWAASTGVDRRSEFDLTISGATGQLICGFDRDGDNRFIITGSAGTLVLHGPFLKATRLSISKPWLDSLPGIGATHQLPGRAGRLVSRLPVPGRRIIDRPFPGGGLQFEARAAMQAIRAGESMSPMIPLDDSIAVLEIIQSVLAQPPETRR